MVRMMLSRWVNHKSYKAALVAGAHRLNLDGSVAGVVSEQEIAHLHKMHNKGQDDNG
jgi:sRNA-binding protein